MSGEISLTRNLRHELAGNEERALRASSSLSAAFGIAWVLLVIFGPRTETTHLLPAQDLPIAVTFEETPAPPKPEVAPPPTPTVAKPTARKPAAAAARPDNSAAIAGAFGAAPASGPVGDVSNVLRGVAVASNAAPVGAATGGKAVLAYGQGGQGSRTPGRDTLGAGGAGSIGAVQGGGTGRFGVQAVKISAPRVIDAPGAGPGRDVGQLGTQVRDHQSQLRFCYDEYGLAANPALAGSVTVALTLTGPGGVSDAMITGRTWSGAGVDATESCIVQRAKSWRFPASTTGTGTYEFSFNFTR